MEIGGEETFENASSVNKIDRVYSLLERNTAQHFDNKEDISDTLGAPSVNSITCFVRLFDAIMRTSGCV